MAGSHERSRRALVLLAAAGIASISLVLAGCVSDPAPVALPGGDAGTDPPSVVSAAGEKTLAAGTARFSMKGSTEASGGGTGTAVAGGSYTMEGSVDFSNGESEVKVVSERDGEEGAVQVITIQDVQYVKSAATGSDNWVERESRNPGTGDSVSVPLNFVNVLRSIHGLQEVGPDPVEEVPATKYTGMTDVQQALQGAGTSLGESDPAAITGEAEISIWIDDQGRIVKTEHKTSAQVGKTGVETEVSTRLFDFGVSLDIQAPATGAVNS